MAGGAAHGKVSAGRPAPALGVMVIEPSPKPTGFDEGFTIVGAAGILSPPPPWALPWEILSMGVVWAGGLR